MLGCGFYGQSVLRQAIWPSRHQATRPALKDTNSGIQFHCTAGGIDEVLDFRITLGQFLYAYLIYVNAFEEARPFVWSLLVGDPSLSHRVCLERHFA